MSGVFCRTCPFSNPRNLTNPKPEWPTLAYRRHAPVTAVDGNGDALPDFPLVRELDGCGDHPEYDPTLRAARTFAASGVALGRLMDAGGNEVAGRVAGICGLEGML